MRGKTLFVLLSLIAVALSGCADLPEEIDETDDTADEMTSYVASHPAYNFLTNDALEESPDGVTGKVVNEDGTITWYKPTYQGLPGAITSLDFLAQAPEVRTGGGIAVFGPYAFIGGRGSGPLYVFDIMDPANPTIAGKIVDIPVRDADTILYPDGRLVVISTAGGRDVFATDVTDPANGTLIGKYETSGSNHNIAVVPGAPIVYNSGMDIVDFSDPENPVQNGTFEGGGGCHDIAFHINQSANQTWALCAGYANTEIWDIADPFVPELIVRIPYPTVENGIPVVGDDLPPSPTGSYPRFPGSFSHLAITNHDGTVLIMGDETGGGAINGCDFYAEGPDGQTFSGPSGNLWFYDITDPENPELRGHVSPAHQDAAGGSCTAHFGKILEDSGFVVMGFYAAGVVLVDFNDLDNPRIADRYDNEGSIWDVQYYQGYLFTGDMSRGMDILSLS